jgi:glycosyltransferase involved in cell wall biosynthesis
LDFGYALRASRHLPLSDITVTNSFSLPLLLPRRTAGKIYVHVARFPKHQMLLYFRADRLQAISQAVAEAIVRQAPGLSPKVVSIGYPVPDGYFCASGTQPRKGTILFVGRLAREKGVDLLLKAFAALVKNAHPNNIAKWKLRIVGPHEVTQGGDGAGYFAELTRLAQPLGSVCELVGPIFDEQALIKEYQAASVFVYPSLADMGEALGLAPLEAMAAGCAVIVSNLRCFDDFVEDGVTGLKFEHRSPDPEKKLTGKLAALIAEPRLIEGIAKKGQMAAHNYRLSVIAKKMLDDFESLLGKPLNHVKS